jgi:hypothetical protein
MNLVSTLQSEKKLMDVAGIEPATPACKDCAYKESTTYTSSEQLP